MSRYRYADWPKSTFRKAMEPLRPYYMTVPFWGRQVALLHRAADNLVIQTPDIVAAAALSYVASFQSREDLLKALAEANETYALKGRAPEVPFTVEWTDTPWGRLARKLHPGEA